MLEGISTTFDKSSDLIIRFAQSLILPKALGDINEPTASFLASYIPEEIKADLSYSEFEEWSVKPGIVWTFILGRKTKTR